MNDDQIGYSNSHRDPGKPAKYDAGFWESGTTKNLMWKLEQKLITAELQKLHTPNLAALDFACGTGRILSLLCKNYRDVTGVDISQPMAELARERCPSAEVMVGDVASDTSLLTKQYDLISSFRFFLNAEPSLRQIVLESLWNSLKPGGHLLFNFHLNPSSMTGLYLRARSFFVKTSSPMLSVKDACQLLENQGLEIVSVQGYGYLPKHRTRPRWPRTAQWIEERFLTLPLPPEVAHSFIIVSRRPKP